MTGQKHLIECHCVLPQFRHNQNIIYHKFVVFSEYDNHGLVIPKYAQCNNCGIIHRVFDISKSEIISGREHNVSIIGINDLKLSLPQQVVTILESYNVLLPTWEEVEHIISNKLWGTYVVLIAEDRDGMIDGKCLRFLGNDSVKIETFNSTILFPV